MLAFRQSRLPSLRLPSANLKIQCLCGFRKGGFDGPEHLYVHCRRLPMTIPKPRTPAKTHDRSESPDRNWGSPLSNSSESQLDDCRRYLIYPSSGQRRFAYLQLGERKYGRPIHGGSAIRSLAVQKGFARSDAISARWGWRPRSEFDPFELGTVFASGRRAIARYGVSKFWQRGDFRYESARPRLEEIFALGCL